MGEVVVDEYGTDRDLLESISATARRIADLDNLQDTLQEIVAAAEDLLAHCDGASLMLVSKGRRVDSPASSSPVAIDSDHAQYEADEGPCLDAIADERTVVIDDLESDDRWPAYRERALALGVRSTISFRLFASEVTLGALNLYSRTPHAFDERSQLVGQVFATHASIAMRAAMTEAGLHTTIRSRDVIGQAKGIIMARHHMTADMAFDLLRRVSQDRNRKLVELAHEVVETGQLP
ncbi:GAF and ANTAR domain-containing protein [Egicoccus halophilus]|uniref:Transcription antitermination regulator n=1 Tax=Egicoccus halophilus TaxID=1670830 RepID=A0A8J3A999_9ACTN|nr:GAF and ANTAR domain-containing protein [Egicoccus halophilus]GGI05190.1 transcription antitermination regulator [Egicoccus halophilus]